MTADTRRISITGAWQLDSWRIHYGDGREPSQPFGHSPGGLLIYSDDGWMSATVHRARREPFPPDQSPRQLDEALITQAYWSYFHYAGTWRLEGDRVIHSVRHSLNPNMAGTEQVRHMKLDGNVLSLSGVEHINGVTRRHELIWRRP
jgi:hypothetical protein